MNNHIAIITGNAHPALALKIVNYLGLPLRQVEVGRFSEGEIRVKIVDNCRGRDVFIIQPTCPPTNDNLMELLIMIDALRRASAERITAVIPFFGYARQDRKDQPRVPITAKLVANLITAAGAHRVLTMDLHAEQIQGFFDIPLDHLYAAPVQVEYIKRLQLRDLVVVTPDVGGIKMARSFSKRLGADLAIVDKRRINATDAEVMNVLGEIKGKNALLIDDMIATAGSLTEAAALLAKSGAASILAMATHPILSGPALERVAHSSIEKVIVTDTIPIDKSRQSPKIEVISVAGLLGEAIKRIHNNESVSSLFL